MKLRPFPDLRLSGEFNDLDLWLRLNARQYEFIRRQFGIFGATAICLRNDRLDEEEEEAEDRE